MKAKVFEVKDANDIKKALNDIIDEISNCENCNGDCKHCKIGDKIRQGIIDEINKKSATALEHYKNHPVINYKSVEKVIFEDEKFFNVADKLRSIDAFLEYANDIEIGALQANIESFRLIQSIIIKWNKATEEIMTNKLAKLCDIYNERVKGIVNVFADISDEELERELARRKKK